jgi:tRNA G10  N-methylase Trm11
MLQYELCAGKYQHANVARWGIGSMPFSGDKALNFNFLILGRDIVMVIVSRADTQYEWHRYRRFQTAHMSYAGGGDAALDRSKSMTCLKSSLFQNHADHHIRKKLFSVAGRSSPPARRAPQGRC